MMGKYNTRGANKRIQRNVNSSKESLSSVAGPDDEISTSIDANKKRKGSKTYVDCEKETKRSKKTNYTHDNYCWKCHKIDAEIECSSCPRAFHDFCVKSAKINTDGNCYVCQQQSIVKATLNIDDEIQLSKLLLHIIDTACPMDKEEYKQIVDWPDLEENVKLISKKDFRLIHDKCVQKEIQYESPSELVDDVKWIHHNCIIIYGDKSPIAKSAKKVLEVINVELRDALDCLECYYKKIGNEPLTFLNICKMPHPLVWAKVKFYPYWPAKCLKVSNGKASVRFFRTHQMAVVPLANVFAMSEDEPSNSSKKLDKKSKTSLDSVMATEELNAYISIFEDHYGSFPYEPINTPFDFEKEESVMKDLVDKHSRKRIVSKESFPSASDNESDSRPAVVDLTDDASETSEDQLQEDASSPLHETENLLGCSIEQAISGNLLPSHHLSNSDDHQNLNWLPQRMPSPTGISISNVISGTDVSSDSGTELLLQVAHCEAEPVMQNNFVMSMPSAEPDPFQSTSVFSQNSVSSSNSLQLCLRNYDRTSSETAGFSAFSDDDADIEIVDEVSASNVKTKINKSDTECILQTILRHDPKSFTFLKQANMVVQQLFIQFWGSAGKLKNPEKIVQSQEYEIRALKLQLEEMRKELSLMKDNYEERLQNADKVLKSFQEAFNKQTKKLEEEKEKRTEEKEKHTEEFRKLTEKYELQLKERIKYSKTEKYCNEIECYKPAKTLCCISGLNTYAYCSLDCKKKDDVVHKNLCKKRISLSKPAEEREDATPGQVAIARGVVQQSTTVIYSSTVETRVQSHTSNKEKTTSSAPQQTSSSNMKYNKVVSAKKIEVARNVNRNHNSSDIY